VKLDEHDEAKALLADAFASGHATGLVDAAILVGLVGKEQTSEKAADVFRCIESTLRDRAKVICADAVPLAEKALQAAADRFFDRPMH